MVYKTNKIEEWRLKPVKDLCSYAGVSIPVSGKGTGDDSPLTPLERLFIAVQADGALQRHQLHCSAYSICVKKERKKERLKWILSQLDNWSQISELRGYDRYIVDLPIGDAKLLSTNFNVNMGYSRANSFIDEVIQWDGHEPKNGVNYRYYSSKVKENADFVAAVAVQAGYKVLNSVEEDDRKETHSPIYRVFMRKEDAVATTPMTKEYLPYDDYVYCVEVPTHMIVVRSEGYTFISGNCHHIGSDVRLDFLKTMSFGYFIGLSATISKKLKQLFKYRYHSEVVSCDIVEAINDDILPEPQILLFPLILDNRKPTEEWEINAKEKGPIVRGEYKDIWKFRKTKQHALLSCTQKQKLIEYDKLIEWFKQKTMQTRNPAMERSWLYQAGKRLEFLANCKLGIVSDILMKLAKERTITFCKTIEQAETVGEYCIHSQNGNATKIYDDFNKGKIDHITAVNILNENANLVNCRYGIFCNITSSETITKQRQGRMLRHRDPVMIIPYFQGTREEELVKKGIEGFKSVRTIHSINEI